LQGRSPFVTRAYVRPRAGDANQSPVAAVAIASAA
jgi:hypothetical protein